MDAPVTMPAWAVTTIVSLTVLLLSLVGWFAARTLDRLEKAISGLAVAVQHIGTRQAEHGVEINGLGRRVSSLEIRTS